MTGKIKSAVEKWWLIFYLNMQAANIYRLNVISSLFAKIIRLSGILIIWHVALKSGSEAFTFQEIFTYYIVGELFMVKASPEWSIASDVIRGTFSARRIKPMNLSFYYWVEDMGVGFSTHVFNLILTLGVAIIGHEYLILPSNPWTYAVFLPAILLGYLINLCISYIMGYLALTVVNIRGLAELVAQLDLILSGRLFPLNIAPGLSFLTALPFAWTFYFPMQVFLENIALQTTWAPLILGFIWLLILVIVTRKVYYSGLKKYEAINL